MELVIDPVSSLPFAREIVGSVANLVIVQNKFIASSLNVPEIQFFNELSFYYHKKNEKRFETSTTMKARFTLIVYL